MWEVAFAKRKTWVVWDYVIVYNVETSDENDDEPQKERESKDK